MILDEFIIVGKAFLILVVASAILYWCGLRFSKEGKGKKKLESYACGEFMQVRVPSQNMFWAIKKVFKIRILDELHSGELSKYLTWILFGLAVLLMYLIILLGRGA